MAHFAHRDVDDKAIHPHLFQRFKGRNCKGLRSFSTVSTTSTPAAGIYISTPKYFGLGSFAYSKETRSFGAERPDRSLMVIGGYCMQFTVNVQELLEGLNTVTRALAARPPKQILEGVLIEAEDDSITLTCSDGSLTIETCLCADVREEGRAVLPGKLFTELCRKLPGGEVTIKVGDNHMASTL